jgi:mevalonate pyrophosphate decarboxylase
MADRHARTASGSAWRWFVGDFVTRRDGKDVFLVETAPGRSVAELTMNAIVAAGLPTYAHKSSAKRAAQRMIERVLNEDF